MAALLDIPVGTVFTRMTTIAPPFRKDVKTFISCRCSCGEERTVRADHLTSGRIKSCGCLKDENASARLRTHGLSHTPEYHAWVAMNYRCYHHTSEARNYRDRGITVCARWQESFENFLADMGARPTPKHTLERIDNDRGYGPDNCCWATRFEQMKNTRTTVMVEYGGRRLCISEWARETGIKIGTISSRLQRGWPPGRALGFER